MSRFNDIAPDEDGNLTDLDDIDCIVTIKKQRSSEYTQVAKVALPGSSGVTLPGTAGSASPAVAKDNPFKK